MEEYVGLFISLSAGGFGTAIIAWIAMQVKVATLNTKIEFLQKEMKEEKTNNKEYYAQINTKMDQVLSKIGSIEINLARMRPDQDI